MKLKSLIILPLISLLCACTTPKDAIKIKFRYQQGTSDYNGYCYYTDDVFEEDSTIYNPKLASISISFAMSSFASSVGDYSKKSHNAKSFLEKAGFSGYEINDDFMKKPETDSIGLLAANKKIGEYTLIAIGVRGAGYFSEWASNFTLGYDENSFHKGFKEAAENYISFAKSYVKSQNINGNVKLWTAAYSRGGATCNIAAGLIDEMIANDTNPLGENINISKKDFFVYTFEAPRGAPYKLNESGRLTVKTDDYNNIFNIVNFNDVVPLVATKELGFTRFGKDIYMPDPVLNLNYEKHMDKMERLYYKMDNSEVLGDYRISDFSYKTLKGFATSDSANSHSMTQGLFLHEFLTDLVEIGMKIMGQVKDQGPLDFYINEVQDGLRSAFRLLYNSEAFKGSLLNVGVAMVTDLGIINEVDYLVSDLTIEGPKAFVQDFRPLLTRGLNKLGLKVDVKEIVDSVIKLLEVLGTMFLSSLLSGKQYQLFNWINMDNIKSIASGHYPELCAAHVKALDPDYVKDPFNDYEKMDGKYYVLIITDPGEYVIVKNNGKTIVNTKAGEEILNEIAYIKRKTGYDIYLPYHEEYDVEICSDATVDLSYFDSEIEEYIKVDIEVSPNRTFRF